MFFFFSSRRRHTRFDCDWSSDVCSSDLLSKVRTVLLDKTGTITEGKPTVTHIVTAKRPDGTSLSPAEVLKWAASVEHRSEHPLADAIVRAAHEKAVDILLVEKFAAMEGRG